MKNAGKKIGKEPKYAPFKPSKDDDADKTGTDKSSDHTVKRKGANKFDKPQREVNPDKTGIDTDSDKTIKKNSE
jgi:hypothetical protein